VTGLDLSAPMLSRAVARLGPVLVRSDAMQMALCDASIDHAVSVWVLHSVEHPVLLFREAARVIRPGGLYVVCTAQRPAPDDPVGAVIAEMSERVDARRGALRRRRVSVDEALGWASESGFTGTVHELERQWLSLAAEELKAIEYRQWPAMRELDEASIDEVTRPAVAALKALPATDVVRRGIAEMVVLRRP